MKYKDLKNAIIGSLMKVGERGTDFKVNLDTLRENLESLNLIPIPVCLDAHRVGPSDIPLFDEYYFQNKMEWLNSSRFMTTIAMIVADNVDEEATAILEVLNTPPAEHPNEDYLKLYSKLIANYQCYFALIVSYKNSAPDHYGENSYYITCRTNKVIFKDPNYVYNPDDVR